MNTTTALGLLGLLLSATVPGASANAIMTETPVCTGGASGEQPGGAGFHSAGQDPTAGVKVWVGANGMFVGICGH